MLVNVVCECEWLMASLRWPYHDPVTPPPIPSQQLSLARAPLPSPNTLSAWVIENRWMDGFVFLRDPAIQCLREINFTACDCSCSSVRPVPESDCLTCMLNFYFATTLKPGPVRPTGKWQLAVTKTLACREKTAPTTNKRKGFTSDGRRCAGRQLFQQVWVTRPDW